MAQVEEVKNETKSEVKQAPKIEIETGCFVCHGSGHWARECTSLPSIYLTEDAPKCYRCGGVGHFARFCPTSEKQFRHRERRASMPLINEWGNYFSDLMNFPITQMSDQMFLIRPDYDSSPSSFENVMMDAGEDEDEFRSDCSSVEYIVEPEDIKAKDDLIEISHDQKKFQVK